jgi:peptidoglycan/LPS O-acetylase OafA/YrhL
MIYLYRDNLRRFVDLFWYLLIPAAVGCIALYYLVSDSLPVIMVCCVLVTLLGLRTPQHKVSLLVNPITKKISALSMEIYLSHMAVLTVLKKLHMTGLTPWGWVNFGLTAVMTLAGALVFSLILNKLLQFTGKLIVRRKKKEHK